MFVKAQKKAFDLSIFIPILVLMGISVFMLNSLSFLTPAYFIFMIIGLLIFFFFSSLDFEILTIFSKYFYFFSIIFLLIPIFIGTATRGTTRWIPIGDFTLQPAELVRPFVFLYLAVFIAGRKKTFSNLVKAATIFFLPAFLILIQPSLGVTLITAIGFLGITLIAGFPKKFYFFSFFLLIVSLPFLWSVLADYQKSRIANFLAPSSDPTGAGYNSLQAAISVGSGGLTGRGLGRGVGTQLAFLPERQTDFIFASVSEELGFFGSTLVLFTSFFLLYRILLTMESTGDLIAKGFLGGMLLSIFAQVIIHVGMNISILPITGLPYPLLSMGGSSLLATMTSLGIVSSLRNS